MKDDYNFKMSVEKAPDQADDSVDPRVQIELERLNSATDEINRLEVDLDEARNQFRQLLTESTIKINTCSKKLGNCIEKARPYYDARIKAKEALQETQKAAVNFERANSAHAAAKEMVYLAEEGLKTEGRTFDHAWQEMLNHATMRVNESESDRTRSEAEHKRASQNYQRAEVRVQRLQKELKKAISKSRPYFELKIHYTQLLEQQKIRVKNLEKQVSNVKVCYADTLKNLEHISDEIHKTRQRSLNLNGRKELGSCEGKAVPDSPAQGEIPPAVTPTATATTTTTTTTAATATKNNNNNSSNSSNYSNGCSCAKDAKNFQSDVVKGESPETGKSNEVYETPKMLTPLSETSTTKYTSYTSASSQPDTDMWSENSDTGNAGKGAAENGVDSSIASPNSENDSSITEPPDAESEDEFYKFPERWNAVNRPAPDLKEIEDEIQSRSMTKAYESERKTSNFFEGVGICSFPAETELNLNFNDDDDEDEDEEEGEEDEEDEDGNKVRGIEDGGNNWTEIKLHSPEDEPFPTIKKSRAVKNELEEDYDIPYSPLSEIEPEFVCAAAEGETEPATDQQKTKVNSSALNNWINKTSWKGDAAAPTVEDGNDNAKSLKGTPRKMNIRRQSLDVLWNNATGEKMKEIFSQSILKLSIGSLSERRCSESKIGDDSDGYQTEGVAEGLKGNDGSSYESNLTSQFGLQFFTKKRSDDGVGQQGSSDDKKSHSPQHSLSNQIGGFITRKEKFFAKKVPSPLEKTLGYLNQDEDSNSDTESLASTDMLTDEQLASLVLDRDLTEIYQDIIS